MSRGVESDWIWCVSILLVHLLSVTMVTFLLLR